MIEKTKYTEEDKKYHICVSYRSECSPEEFTIRASKNPMTLEDRFNEIVALKRGHLIIYSRSILKIRKLWRKIFRRRPLK